MHYNLKKQDNFLKGDIAEVIVKHKVRYCHRTREISRDFLKKEFPFKIKREVLQYLYKYWYTIDLFKFELEHDKVEKIVVYEVKARNWYSNPDKVKFKIPNITARSLKVYKEAISLGFAVKYAEVRLLDDWNYELVFKDFNEKDFIVHNGGTEHFNKIKSVEFKEEEFKSIF